MLQRLHNDLFTLAEAYRAKLPARDVEALAKECVSGIRALVPTDTLELGRTLESIQAGLDVDGVCHALSMAKGGVATGIDLTHIKTASSAFQVMAMMRGTLRIRGGPVEFQLPIETPTAAEQAQLSDAARGRKVKAGATAGHVATHGDKAVKQKRWGEYQSMVNAIRTRNPHISLTEARRRTADHFSVRYETVLRHTK